MPIHSFESWNDLKEKTHLHPTILAAMKQMTAIVAPRVCFAPTAEIVIDLPTALDATSVPTEPTAMIVKTATTAPTANPVTFVSQAVTSNTAVAARGAPIVLDV